MRTAAEGSWSDSVCARDKQGRKLRGIGVLRRRSIAHRCAASACYRGYCGTLDSARRESLGHAPTPIALPLADRARRVLTPAYPSPLPPTPPGSILNKLRAAARGGTASTAARRPSADHRL